MKDNLIQMPTSMVLVRGTLRGTERQADCDLLMRKEPLAGADRSATRAYRYTQWVILHAPFDLPDGEYEVVTEDSFEFPATRVQGLWLHGEVRKSSRMDAKKMA